ncbi:uncharacterized protein LOC105907379 [Clupea harengus]|uniref:Uncharacterized protein LOC105907379 n=1 Tax=Clupea harengus TaxID=7950 RepID=A0A6P8FFE0_CLUHA|nr:uncharacterized protein LOC105907379 [Clupea harengus]
MHTRQVRPKLPKRRPIKPGIPACYLLQTEKSEVDGNSAVRRWTFGERDKSRTTKTILMIGETGTGKTTLINTMVNFMLGVGWEDIVWFQIMEEDKKKSQAESQTSAITVYELFLETSSSCLRIIDTPGYGDTSSKEFDEHIAANLEVLFSSEDGIHEIDVVGLVVKSTQNRLTEFQSYILNAILSVFGKDIKNNIAVFITHSDGLPAANVITSLKEAGVPCAKDTGGEPLHFMFNNRQTDSREENFKSAWDLGQNSMKSFLSFLQDIDVKQLRMTQGVLRERKRLEACVYNLQDAIKMEELKQKEVQQTQSALEENRKKLEKNEDFTYEIEKAYKAKVPIQPSWWKISKEATCCTICEENCHYPGCWLVKDLSWCSVMKDNRCTVCTGKCPVSAHVKENMIYVPKTQKVTGTSETLKRQCQDLEKYKEDLQKQLNESIVKKADLLEQAYQCIVNLEEIALKGGSTIIHLDFLIEKMKETGDNDKVQKLEELNKDIQPSKKKRLARWAVL